MKLPAKTNAEAKINLSTDQAIRDQLSVRQTLIQSEISKRNAVFFEAEADKLDNWVDDLKSGLEREIKEIDRLIREARRSATAALSLEGKLAAQKQIKTLSRDSQIG